MTFFADAEWMLALLEQDVQDPQKQVEFGGKLAAGGAKVDFC